METPVSPPYSVTDARLYRACNPSHAYFWGTLEAMKYRSPIYSVELLETMLPQISSDIARLESQVFSDPPPEGWDGRTWERETDRLARWKALKAGMQDALAAKIREASIR